MWVAPMNEIETQTSVCLDSTNPKYKGQSKLYNPEEWRIY